MGVEKTKEYCEMQAPRRKDCTQETTLQKYGADPMYHWCQIAQEDRRIICFFSSSSGAEIKFVLVICSRFCFAMRTLFFKVGEGVASLYTLVYL